MQGTLLHEDSREFAVAQRGAETYEKTVEEVRTHDPDFDHDHAFSGFVTALRSEEWKYVAGDEERALYDLPVETEDVSAANPTVADEFATRLDDWLADHEGDHHSSAEAEFDDEVKQQLADLGYVVD